MSTSTKTARKPKKRSTSKTPKLSSGQGSDKGAYKMTSSHKDALAEGRAQGHAINRYLEALETYKPRRGRRVTAESITKRLRAISDQMDSASLTGKVQLVQERLDLLSKLETVSRRSDLDKHKEDFIKNAKAYSERKGITYAAWREAGVPADVLRDAGIGK